MQNLIGQSLGRYHILEKLGEGGMAVVYKAYDTHLERDVAIKVIRRNAFSPDALERVLKRFDREAKSLARLIHPNIVPLIDYGEHEGNPYLVMPYLAGGTLKQYLGQPMLYHKAAALLMPVAEALAYAHQKSIVHRDVKPGNILITENGKPMLGDFGVARLLENEETQTLTGTGVGVGTPEYMSPEQGLGREADGRTDVYSLGVVFYELVTGRKPYTADTPMAVVLMQTTEPLPRPRNFVPELPEQVEHVLLKALQKNSADRYQSMEEFAAALRKLEVRETEIESLQKPKPMITETPADDADTYGTVDQLETRYVPPVPAEQSPVVSIPKPVEAMDPNRKGESTPVWKIVGFSLGGIVILMLVIGAASGWFKEKPAAAEVVTEAPVQNEVSITTKPTATTKSTATVKPTTTAKPTATVKPAAGTEKVSDKDGMVMVYVPAGEFTMGSPRGVGYHDEYPEHQVYLSGYWIDQTEVTNAMFAKFVQETEYQTDAEKDGTSYAYVNGSWGEVSGANWRHPQGPGSTISGIENHPVVHVSWNDAVAYCEWAGRELPTEAQWEKAARGTDGRTYPWGNTPPNSGLANYDWNIGDTTKVGSYPEGASPYGALDMAGNVWEWVADWYGEYPTGKVTDPQGPSMGDYRVIRGGSWFDLENNIRSANRFRYDPDSTYDDYGFRCSLSLP